MATLTGGIGTGSKWLLDKIVGALAATGVNPNFLTFLGLVVNTVLQHKGWNNESEYHRRILKMKFIFRIKKPHYTEDTEEHRNRYPLLPCVLSDYGLESQRSNAALAYNQKFP